MICQRCSNSRKFVILLFVSSCCYFGPRDIAFWVVLLFSQTVWSHSCETLREKLLPDPDTAGDAFSLSKLETRVTQSWRKLRLTFLSGTTPRKEANDVEDFLSYKDRKHWQLFFFSYNSKDWPATRTCILCPLLRIDTDWWQGRINKDNLISGFW